MGQTSFYVLGVSDATTSAAVCPHTVEPRAAQEWPANKTWDGAPGVWPRPAMLVEARDNGGKLWRMPAQFISATPDQAIDCDEKRIDACYDNFLCTVCGDPISELGDGTGWLLGRSIIGGACCTRCAWLSVLSCPRLKEDGREMDVWTCRDTSGYCWRENDPSESVGHVVATDDAIVSSCGELEQVFRLLKQISSTGRCPVHA